MRHEVRPEQNLDEFEERLTQALQTRPTAHIPADFAARVMQQLPRQRPVILARTNYGRLAMIVCMVVLGVSLPLVIALHGIASAPAIRATEWLLYAQFLALVLWFGVPGELRKDG